MTSRWSHRYHTAIKVSETQWSQRFPGYPIQSGQWYFLDASSFGINLLQAKKLYLHLQQSKCPIKLQYAVEDIIENFGDSIRLTSYQTQSSRLKTRSWG